MGYLNALVPRVTVGERTYDSQAWDAGTVGGADGVVVIIAHDQFSEHPLWRHARSIVDTRNVVPPGPGVHHL